MVEDRREGWGGQSEPRVGRVEEWKGTENQEVKNGLLTEEKNRLGRK